MNTFKNCGKDYRGVVLTPDILGGVMLSAVFNKDRESTYQVLDPENHLTIGVLSHSGVSVQVATPDKTRTVTFADPVVQSCIKQLPWLRDWLLGTERGIPESVVSPTDYVIAEIRRGMVLMDCRSWGLPAGVTETLVACADRFSKKVNLEVADFRQSKLPASTLLYGVRPGQPAERIPTIGEWRMTYGYPILLEVCPAKGLVTVHKNNKRRTNKKDWVMQFEFEQATRKINFCPDLVPG